MDLWGILVGEVPKEKEVAVIVVLATSPALQEGDTIEIRIHGVAHHFYLIECHLDITIALEHATKILDILLL